MVLLWSYQKGTNFEFEPDVTDELRRIMLNMKGSKGAMTMVRLKDNELMDLVEFYSWM